MIKGKTKSGFNYEIDEEALNDYRLLKEIARVEEEPLRFPFLLERLLTSEQEEKLLNHLEDEKGIVDPDKVMDEIKDIFSNTKPLKN